MINELQTFNFNEHEVRSILIDDQPWFVGKDVAKALGYADPDQAIRRRVDKEDRLTRQIDGSGQSREMTIINESGLYSLILSSKLSSAKSFKRWVTSEVLPAIRKTGGYNADKQVHIDPDQFTAALTAIHALTDGLPNRYETIQALVKPLGVTLPSQPETPASAAITDVTGKINRTRYGVREFVNDRGMGFITSYTVDKVYDTYFAYAALRDHDPLSFTDFSYELKNVYRLDQFTRYGDDKRALGRYYVPR